MIILLFFIFAALLLGSFHIGGISIRVILSVIMLIALFIPQKKRVKTNVKYTPIILYSVFLVISYFAKLISGMNSGVDELTPFLTNLLAYFLLCYISYFAIFKFVSSMKDIKFILILLVGICVFNDIVTYLQYIGNPLGIRLGMIFYTSEGGYIANIAENIDRLQDMRAAMPGIFGHGAFNGYMTSSLGILSLYFCTGNGKKYWILGFVLFALALVGAFCCQERAGFGLLILFSLITFWKFSSKNNKFIIPIIFIGLIIFNLNSILDLMQSQEMGRYAELTKFEDNRSRLVSNAIRFISSNFFIGGEVLYSKLYGVTPHNVILHAFIFSGLLGACVVLILTFYIIRNAYKTIINSHTASMVYFFACGLTIYLITGFFHSSSLITGDVCIWILYGCMLKGNQLINNSTKL